MSSSLANHSTLMTFRAIILKSLDDLHCRLLRAIFYLNSLMLGRSRQAEWSEDGDNGTYLHPILMLVPWFVETPDSEEPEKRETTDQRVNTALWLDLLDWSPRSATPPTSYLLKLNLLLSRSKVKFQRGATGEMSKYHDVPFLHLEASHTLFIRLVPFLL